MLHALDGRRGAVRPRPPCPTTAGCSVPPRRSTMSRPWQPYPGSSLSRVARAVEIGRRTLRVALQSIWIGIAVSVVLMGVAAFGYIPAIAGAATQEVVDLITILNALQARSAGRGGRNGGGQPMSGTPTQGAEFCRSLALAAWLGRATGFDGRQSVPHPHESRTPPSTTIWLPVMYDDISEARNRATLPISSGSPIRAMGIRARNASSSLLMSAPSGSWAPA